MIARNLSVALLEAIKAHAEQHHRGMIDLDRTISALADVAASFLAELTTDHDRRDQYGALIQGVAQKTARKLISDIRPTTTQ
jgi:hypothetical protein